MSRRLRLLTEDWPLIEKIRRTGRLDHGAFGDEYSSSPPLEEYARYGQEHGIRHFLNRVKGADRKNFWLTESKLAELDWHWSELEKAEQERLELYRRREKEMEETRRETYREHMQLLEDRKREQARRDAEWKEAEKKARKSWITEKRNYNPSLRFTEEELQTMLAEARALIAARRR